MLTLMLSALLTSAPGTVSVEAKSDTVNHYVIDGKPVSNFDGTQLAGKAIASYDITTTKEKGKVVQNHIITLAAPVEKQNDIFNQFFRHDDEDYSEMTKTTTVTDNGILRTTTEGTLKNGGKVKTTSTQIGIRIAPDYPKDTKVYIDGEEATMEDFQKLKPSEIKSITVLKDKAAVKVWGDDAACGVIEVKTVKDNK